MFCYGFLVWLAICMVNCVQAQQYILNPQFHFQAPNDDFYNQHKPPHYQQFPGFSNLDSYLPQRDLQTSDLPFHLQKTLPQYRYTSKEQLPKNGLRYQNNVIFRPDHERGLQNVAPSTHRPNYSHFLSQNHNRNPSQTETFLGQITLDNGFSNFDDSYNIQEDRKHVNVRPSHIPDKFLRQHTRILAPDPEDKQNQLQRNEYFVNENGEVFSTTKTPPGKIFPAKKLSAKLEIDGNNPNSQDFPKDNIIDSDKSIDQSAAQDQIYNSANNFDLTDYEYEDDESRPTTKSKSVTVSTAQPLNNSLPSDTSENVEESENTSSEEYEEESDEKTEIAEPVISVVTTKSVINNTVVATTISPTPYTTKKLDTNLAAVENTTDSWVVVASVQTSKSISGAHYLPSSIVSQEERFAVLNEKERLEKLNDMSTTEEYSSYEDYDVESSTEEITTQAPVTHSIETSTDNLQKVESDLSAEITTSGDRNEDNNIAILTKNMTDKMQRVDMTEPPVVVSQILPPAPKSHFPIIKKFSPHSRPPTINLYPKRKPQPYKKPPTTTTTPSSGEEKDSNGELQIIIGKPDGLLPPGYKPPIEKDNSSELLADILSKFKGTATKKNEDNELISESDRHNKTLNENPIHRFASHNSSQLEKDTLPHNITESSTHPIDVLLKIAKPVDIKSFLPPGYTEAPESTPLSIDSIISKTKVDDISAFLPPGFELKSLANPKNKNENTSVSEMKFTSSTTKTPSSLVDAILKKSKQDDLSGLLPPGFKPLGSSTKKPSKIEDILQNSKEDDISAFLPPGFKPKTVSTTSKSKIKDLFEQSLKDDISALLPPGFKSRSFTTPKPTSLKPKIEVENLPTSLLPSGYKSRKGYSKSESTSESSIATTTTTSTTMSSTTTGKQILKVVFPSRPGGKRINHKLTTPKPREERKDVTQAAAPTIHKGWPSRATTEFTGWPTPSTTPISIEKLLEAVQRASSTSETPENVPITTTTQITVTSTTTTPKPTTPGVCESECDLVGTIKLVDGVKWVPELLDRNTKEWQLLANDVRSQLEDVYTKSPSLSELYKNLRIDGFSEGSVLVDYLVEMNNVNMHVSTLQIKKLFNEALESTLVKATPREGKSLNETVKYEEKAKLGKFIIDPQYTDFIVVPKTTAPTVGYAEDNILLPQWAIAVIVIGLASLLFVIIFGVTVLVNRSKNAKKKVPTPLTDEMLNELNKSHMGGLENYGVEDPYSVEAGFWDPRRMDAHREYNKLPKKGSSGSLHENSMTHLYDSWKSQWNGYYNNSTGGYYGNPGSGSNHRLYDRRRSYDTNF